MYDVFHIPSGLIMLEQSLSTIWWTAGVLAKQQVSLGGTGGQGGAADPQDQRVLVPSDTGELGAEMQLVLDFSSLNLFQGGR